MVVFVSDQGRQAILFYNLYYFNIFGMKKYVPVKLKIIVLFFKNRATHVFWEQSQNKAKRSEETIAIEIKF